MKKYTVILLCCFIAILLVVGFLVKTNVRAYDSQTTHPLLAQQTAELYNAVYKPALTQSEINNLMQGSIDEDTPPRWINHFYDPTTGLGWLGKRLGNIPESTVRETAKIVFNKDPVSALDWVDDQNLQTRQYSLYSGNRTFEAAVLSFLDGKNDDSYYNLGHILHIIEDMSVPAHTRQDTHWDMQVPGPLGDLANSQTDKGEPYEIWAKNNGAISGAEMAQLKQNYKPVCSSLTDCLKTVAAYSNNNFFSQDSIQDSDYQNPEILYYLQSIENNKVFRYYYDKNNNLLFRAELDEDNKTLNNATIDLPEIQQSYWDHLAPKAIMAGVEVIKYFQDEKQQAKNSQLAVRPPAPASFWQIIQSLSPYGEAVKLYKFAQGVLEYVISNPGVFTASLDGSSQGASSPAGATSSLEEQAGQQAAQNSSATLQNLGMSQGQAQDALDNILEQLDSASQNGVVVPSYPKILINEIQIAGSINAKNEFVELYNPNNFAVPMDGWSLTHRGSTGQGYATYVSKNAMNGTSIPAKGYYLIARKNSDFESLANVVITAGQPLTNDNTLVLVNPNGDTSDKVGWGNAQDYETKPTINPPIDESISRIWDSVNNTAQDTDNNWVDFGMGIPPTPKKPNSICGDGICNGSETCSTCSKDCGSCGGGGGGSTLQVSCITRPNPADTTQQVTFAATATGGSNYYYSWAGDCTATASTSANCQKTFSAVGTKTATVTVTIGPPMPGGALAIATCSVVVVPKIQASCIASPNPADTTQQVTFAATATGGISSNYYYSWAGDCVLSPSSPANANCLKTFAITGNYTATVSVTSGPPALLQTVGTATCPVIVGGDTTPPVITLKGSPELTVTAGHGYTDAGATALDNVDGDITSKIATVNPVDSNAKGDYTITYNVSDAAGNKAAQVTRLVHVADPFAVSCSALPSPAIANEQVSFTPQTPFDSVGCNFSWTGDCISSQEICTDSFQYSGNYTAAINSACNGQFGAPASCSVGVLGPLPPKIVWANNPDDISVPFGTPLAGLNLPPTVSANLSNGDIADLPVTWSASGYDGNTAGTYNFTGTFNEPLPDHITNPDDVTANINVTVEPYEPHLLITEIQTAGAAATDTYNEFIELYNPTFDTINLTGYALKKETAGGTSTASYLVSHAAFVGSVDPFRYFLIAPQDNPDGSKNYSGLWAPDLRYSGKVTSGYSIADKNTVLLYDDSGKLLDKVGYGNVADYETAPGLAPTVNPPPGESIGRILDFDTYTYQDTDNNLNDFELQKNPTPRQDPLPPLTATCRASPLSAIVNQSVNFLSEVSGGIFGQYNYSWSGDCTGTGATCTKSFASASTYTANLAVTSGGDSASTSCQVDVTTPIPQAIIKDVTGCLHPDTCTHPDYSSSKSGGNSNSDAGIEDFLPHIKWGSPDSASASYSYHVQYKRNNDPQWHNWFASTTATSAIFGSDATGYALYDMLNDEVYSFQVQATNSQGGESLWQQVSVDLRNPVVINEVAPFGTGAGPDGWLELYNKSDSDVDLTGWQVRGGHGTTDSLVINLSGSIPAKGYLLIDKAAYFPGGAINTSGYLRLFNNKNGQNRQTDNFYIPLDGWQQTDFQKNGQYYSMERVSPYGLGSNPNNWKLSTSADYGTPGSRNTDYQLYTPVSTDFAENTDLPVSQNGVTFSPYLLQGFVTVYQNKTLTIEPGVVLKFIVSVDPLVPSGMMIWGNLQAHGTSGSPIVFTSMSDDDYAYPGCNTAPYPGCDTDEDSGQFPAHPGYWNGIKFTADSSGSQMDNVVVRYAGGFSGIGPYDFGAGIKIDTTSVSLSNSTIEKNANNGLYLLNSDSTVDSAKILDNKVTSSDVTGGKGIDIEGGSPTITNSDFERNYYGIFAIISGGSPTIQNCTFGDPPDDNNFKAEPASLIGQ